MGFGKAKFAIAGLLIVAAVVYLIVSSTGSMAHYFLTVEELQAMAKEVVGRNVAVSGAVLGNTILRGQLGKDGRFHADELLLNCPTRYEEDVPGQIEEP